jgi:hypothetical protein
MTTTFPIMNYMIRDSRASGASPAPGLLPRVRIPGREDGGGKTRDIRNADFMLKIHKNQYRGFNFSGYDATFSFKSVKD